MQLIWKWEGNLEANEYFDIRIWDDESAATPRHTVWADKTDVRLDLSGLPTRFYWSVWVIRGHYEGSNRVFDGALSPDSERWWIEWSGQRPEPADTPQPTNTPEK